MLRKEINPSPEIIGLREFYSGQDLVLNLEITSGADWTSLEILNPEVIRKVEISSVDGPLTNYSATPNFISMNQLLADARAGRRITLQVNFVIDGTFEANKMEMILKKGSINNTVLKFYRVVDGVRQVLIQEIDHSLTRNDNSGENPMQFSIPLDSLQ